jgi:hypothetical protein
LEVGRCVAGEGEHLFPTENVVALAIGEEVRVFDGADADDACDFAAIVFVHGWAFLGDDGVGALFGFVEEVGEFYGFAAAGFKGLVIGAQNGAEPDVAEFCGGGFPLVERGEELAEVELLAAIGDVDDFIGMPCLDAVGEGGEVGGGVEGGAVGFLDEHRRFFEVGLIEENDDGAFAFAGHAFGNEVLDDGFELGIVKAFAEDVVEMDAEAVVDFLEFAEGEADHFLPEGEVFGIAVLEFDEFLAGFGFDFVAGFEFGVDLFVEAAHFFERGAIEGFAVEVFFPANEELAELGAPVADVVVGDDAVAEVAEGTGDDVADAGGADVADVHGLGDVGGAEVDHVGSRLRGGGDEEVLAAMGGEEGVGDGGGGGAEVEEAGAGDFDFVGEVGDVELFEDFFGKLAGVPFALFGEGHEGVALVVAKLGIGGGADLDGGEVGVGQDDGDGGLDAFF